MERQIIYKDESQGDVAVCKELCDQLMRYQASKTDAQIYKRILGSMCFENRLLPGFHSARERQLIVAYDGKRPVGYVFSTAETVTKQNKNARPQWALQIPGDTLWLYPDWLTTPAKIGDLNNLYVLPAYRGEKIGQGLMARAMAWLRGLPDAKWLFVYIANGNDVAAFYKRYGFAYSHEVLGGLIHAYYQRPAGAMRENG